MIPDGKKESLASYADRIKSNANLGMKKGSPAIDVAHRVMFLFSGKRKELLVYLQKKEITKNSSLWRVLNSLVEILPRETADYKNASELLTNRDSILRDTQNLKGDQQSF